MASRSELQNSASNTSFIRQIIDRRQPPAAVLACSKIPICVLLVAEVSVGVRHLNDCPRQRYIPIYLIMMGAFSLALALLSCLPCAQKPKDGSTNPLSRICATWNSLITCFLFCWFIAGNVWIYSIYKPNFDKSTTDVDPYCDMGLYVFAFWVTTVVYIVIGLLMIAGCCKLIYSTPSSAPSSAHQQHEMNPC